MSKTIFCTFEQQDLADIAMGRLRSDVAGIQSIQYVQGRGGQRQTQNKPHDDGVPFAATSAIGGFWPVEAFASTSQTAPLGAGAFLPVGSASSSPVAGPVTVKIVCDQQSQKNVVSKLVNLHAQKIVSIS